MQKHQFNEAGWDFTEEEPEPETGIIDQPGIVEGKKAIRQEGQDKQDRHKPAAERKDRFLNGLAAHIRIIPASETGDAQ